MKILLADQLMTDVVVPTFAEGHSGVTAGERQHSFSPPLQQANAGGYSVGIITLFISRYS